ncbi:MAG TPA: GNAT family N-acetyltransferase [Fervidobacterium sp.]|nr:GNAT family N-acetyltransferase [Thermotogaceae bacterium]HPC78630.1 GNAT family N-acetyltransferase [Fervidobacterium sp.]HRT01520.1 GNAT family N-acetyltransferase [Fervidobacterium sp.]
MEVIRKAEISDANVVSSLILEAGLSFLPLVFGPQVKLILGRLIKTPGTVFYIDNVYVLEIDDGKIVGAMVAYPGYIIKKRSLKTALVLFETMGMELIKRIRIFRLVESKNRVSRDEFYVSNIAIDGRHRKKGYGSRLLKYAEELAREQGLRKLSLDVENTNSKAIEFYKRLGYRGTKVKRIYIRGNLFTFVRMQKLLDNSQYNKQK